MLNIICAVGLLVPRLISHTRSDNDYSGTIISCVYLILGLLDLIIMLIVLRKVTRYQAEKRLQPESAAEVHGIACI